MSFSIDSILGKEKTKQELVSGKHQEEHEALAA